MEPLRSIPVFDARAQPQSWSQRMAETEYGVMLADARTGSPCLLDGTAVMDVQAAPVHVFPSFSEAEAWSRRQVQRLPELRCRIYDAHGLAGQPVEIRDSKYAREDGFSRRTSLRIAIGMLATGIALCTAEWLSDFHLSWAAMVGTRLLPVGLLLLVTEGALRLNDWENRRRERPGRTLL